MQSWSLKCVPVSAFFIFTLVGISTQASLFDQKLMINGAGATFPYPLYSKWFAEYQKKFPQVAFNYQSIGSGGGIRQLLDETVDFGASDAPMSDEQLKKAKHPIVHVPGTMGAVVMTYNLPYLKANAPDGALKLSGAALADIFLGKLKKWNDPRILELNPELKDVLEKNPDQDILVVHRSDGSGTTSIFSEYLSKVSEIWKTKVGKGTALRWPVGIGGKGNEGVTSFVKQIPGSVGFVELVFAKTLKLPYASLENSRKEFVEPSMTSVAAAAQGALDQNQIPEDFRTSLTLVDAAGAYPISSLTYILIYDHLVSDPKGQEKQANLMKFLHWGLRDGQKMAANLFYAPLPDALIERIEKRISKVNSTEVSTQP